MNNRYQERIREACSLLLLNAGYEKLYANWNWKNVYSPFARIYIVTEGEAMTVIDGQEIVLRPNHLYLTPPFTLHHDYCDSHFSLYYIHLFDQTSDNLSIFKRLDLPIEVTANELDIALAERLLKINPNTALDTIDPDIYDNSKNFNRHILNQKKKNIHNLIETEGILKQLISRFLINATLKEKQRDERLRQVLTYIHDHIDEEISISHLADIACTSNDHLIRIFKREMHKTPIQYINNKRMERAQLLLLTTEKSIREIAHTLSIENVSYFNLLFKKTTGKSPKDFRNSF